MRATAFSGSIVAAAHVLMAGGAVVDFERDAGAVPDIEDNATAWANGAALNATLAALAPGDVLLVPNKTFHVMGGIVADDLDSVVLRIDGTVRFSTDQTEWPRRDGDQVLDCISGHRWRNVTLTSGNPVGEFGTFDGRGGDGPGSGWWGSIPFGSLSNDNRPKLIKVEDARDVLIEKIFLKDAPFWTFHFHGADGLEVRHSKIDARRTDKDKHGLVDLSAWNTDGFDVSSSRNVWIHDCDIWAQDDCIAVKDGNPSENMLFERLRASGLGLTIGSIGGGSHVRNITFRDIYMHNTYKGIYAKFRDMSEDATSIIEDVTWENIVMDEPEQYPIWIGPSQQNEPDPNICAAHTCSICWPVLPSATCAMPKGGIYRNLTVRNVTINAPKGAPGVVMGVAGHPMTGVVFEDVRVNDPAEGHWGLDYFTSGLDTAGCVARGSTYPVPVGFIDETAGRSQMV